jgi:N-acyl-D-aspartate/D-glutamate deacylase
MNLGLDEQIALYSSADWREQARREFDSHQRQFPFTRTRIKSSLPEYAEIGDNSVADLAHEWARHPLDIIVEIACKERLQTRFIIEKSNYDPAGIAWALAQPEFLVGLSDGGAHLDQLCDAKYPAVLLGRWVRDRGALSLEEAIRKLTSVPARLFDLPRRGLIRENYIADLVLFDPHLIDTTSLELVADLPGGETRLVARSVGIKRVYVRGRETLRDGDLTQERPGRVLRRGKS